MPRWVLPAGKTPPPTASTGSGALQRSTGAGDAGSSSEERSRAGPGGAAAEVAPWPGGAFLARTARYFPHTVNLCVTPTAPGGMETPGRNHSGRAVKQGRWF